MGNKWGIKKEKVSWAKPGWAGVNCSWQEGFASDNMEPHSGFQGRAYCVGLTV